MMDVFFNHEARVRREKRSNSEAAIKKEAEEQQDCIFYKIFSCSPLLFFSRGGRDFNQTIHKITKPQNLHTCCNSNLYQPLIAKEHIFWSD
jgi:hypothetical protein